MNIESLLASKLLANKNVKNVLETDLIVDEESNKIYFLMKVKTGKTLKDGTEQIRVYKNDISKYVQNHGSVEAFFKSLVVSEMMLSGYMIIPIQGGFMCVGGEDVYALKDNTCTCQAFNNDTSKPCKHLIYKDGLLNQRARMNEWKQSNLM